MPCAVGPRRTRLWRCCARWPVVVEAPRSMVFNDQESGNAVLRYARQMGDRKRAFETVLNGCQSKGLAKRRAPRPRVRKVVAMLRLTTCFQKSWPFTGA